jgi:hypothetical protein
MVFARRPRSEHRGGDDLEGKRFETDTGRRADALQAPAHDAEGVLGWEQENRSGMADRIPAQAGHAGGDADGQIEGEEAFAAFGLSAEDANRLVGPQALDEPVRQARGFGGDLAGFLVGQQVHAAARGLPAFLGSCANTSK